MDQPPSPAAGRAWGLAAALIVLSLLVVLARRREAAEIYAVGLTAFFLFYFTFATRLALPIYAIGLAATFDFVGSGLRSFLPRGLALVGAAALAAFFIVANFEPYGPRADLEARHREALAIADAVRPLLRPEDRLASARGPRWSVYLDRPVYNLRHAIRRAGRLDAAEAIIDKYGIDAVLLCPSDPEDRTLVTHFETLHGPGRPVASALLWLLPPHLELVHRRSPLPAAPARGALTRISHANDRGAWASKPVPELQQLSARFVP